MPINELVALLNPTHSTLTIKVIKSVIVNVFNAQGVFIQLVELEGETNLDVLHFDAGLYIIFTSEGRSLKFIKEKRSSFKGERSIMKMFKGFFHIFKVNQKRMGCLISSPFFFQDIF